jgi:exonuclease III
MEAISNECTDVMDNSIVLENYLFNPFELNDDNPNSPLLDLDPDLHYFNNRNTSSCEYYNENSFVEKYEELNVKCSSFSLIHTNIRSVSKHLSELDAYIKSLNHIFHVIGLSETWLKPDNANICHINGYHTVSKYRQQKSGGGVSILVRDTIQYNVRDDISVFSDSVENVFIEIPKCNFKDKRGIIVGVLYRPPGTCVNDFLTSLTEILSVVKREKKICYIMGDYNINLLNCESHIPTSEFLETMYSFSYSPFITKPTRVTVNSATIIDNIFCNEYPKSSFQGVCFTDISDHFPIFYIDTHSAVDDKSTQIKPQRNYTKHNIELFSNKLQSLNWNEVLNCNDSQKAYTLFHEKFRKCYDVCFPLKCPKSVYKVRKTWLTEGLKKSIKVKNKLYVYYLKHPTLSNKKTYKMYRNKLHNLLRRCEKDHYDKIFNENKNNIRKSWAIIKEIINKKKESILSDKFLIDNQLVDDRHVIADSFNKFYVNIGPTLASTIPQGSTDPTSYISSGVSNSIFLESVEQEEIVNIVKALKNASPGCDELTSMVVKTTIQHFIMPITHVMRLSLQQGVVPTELKIARVIPIFKGGDKTLVSNYRPVSVLPVFSKVLEKLMYNRLLNFLNKHKVLYDYQFGFRQKHNTNSALIVLVGRIVSALDEGKSVLGVFLDFSKAFDTVNHNILLEKLYKYGVRGIALKWFQSYLSDRRQFVVYNNTESGQEHVVCGVPQGSILGPLLFLLFYSRTAIILTLC